MPRNLLAVAAVLLGGCAPSPRADGGVPGARQAADAPAHAGTACETTVRDAIATALAGVGAQWGEAHVLSLPSGGTLTVATHGPVPPGPHPPASTVKPFLALAALEVGVVDPADALPCSGSWTYQGQTARCFFDHPPQTLESALATSCNVYFYELASRLTPTQLADRWARLGHEGPAAVLRDSTSIDFIAAAVGHGIAVDTARHAAAYARLLTSDSPHLPVLRAGLRRTFEAEDGSAHDIHVEGVTVGGKTCTASDEGERDAHAWLAAYAPADAPRVLVLAHAYGEGTGATLAGPVAKAAIEAWHTACDGGA